MHDTSSCVFQSAPPGSVKDDPPPACLTSIFDCARSRSLARILSPRSLSLSLVLLPIVRRQRFTVKAPVNNISPAYKRYVKAHHVSTATRERSRFALRARAKAGNCTPQRIDHRAIKSAAIKRTKGDYRSSWIAFGDLAWGALFPLAIQVSSHGPLSFSGNFTLSQHERAPHCKMLIKC